MVPGFFFSYGRLHRHHSVAKVCRQEPSADRNVLLHWPRQWEAGMDAIDNAFAEVARKIGDSRLEKVLRELADNIENEVHNAQFATKRSDVRANMKQLKRDAQRLERSINVVSRHQLELPLSGSECLPRARHVIAEIVALCDETRAITSSRSGTNKKSGIVICALIMVEAWTATRGRPPGHNNPEFQAACEDYWRASAGKADTGDASRWWRHILAAKKITGRSRKYLRADIARALA
jgi:hypothetical protein